MTKSWNWLVVAVVVTVGWKGLTAAKNQFSPAVCSNMPRDTYGVFVPHHGELDKGNLADFSKFKQWDFEKRCKWFVSRPDININGLTLSSSSEQTYRIGTLIGPFGDQYSAQSALQDVQKYVRGTNQFILDRAVVSSNSPFVVSSNERSNYTTVTPEEHVSSD